MLIQKYSTNWPTQFNAIKSEIEKALGESYTIEHVGSTSVEGLDAKPIIDIDIVYEQQDDFQSIKKGLHLIGYVHNGDQGILGREAFKRNLRSNHNILDRIPHHLYVCSCDNLELERHLLFRNFLRKNEWARVQYQQLKYDLAIQANQDRKVYAELKELKGSEFIESIILQARKHLK